MLSAHFQNYSQPGNSEKFWKIKFWYFIVFRIIQNKFQTIFRIKLFQNSENFLKRLFCRHFKNKFQNFQNNSEFFRNFFCMGRCRTWWVSVNWCSWCVYDESVKINDHYASMMSRWWVVEHRWSWCVDDESVMSRWWFGDESVMIRWKSVMRWWWVGY